MQGVEVELLHLLGSVGLGLAGAVLCHDAALEVLLGGVGDDVAAQELGVAGCVAGLFPSCGLVVGADLGIALAVGDAGHGQVHASLGALAVVLALEEVLELCGDLGEGADADDVLGCPGHLALVLNLFDELGARDLAQRADKIGGQLVAVVLLDVTAHGADELHGSLLFSRRVHVFPCASIIAPFWMAGVSKWQIN